MVLNRTPQTAQKLAREAKAKTIRRDQVAKSSFDVIVNATPVGMHGVNRSTFSNRKRSTPGWSSIWSITRWILR